MWSVAEIADALANGLERACETIDVEQAVYGIDARDEVSLHPIIEDAFTVAGLGVHREQRYPAVMGKRSRSEGERCDFVLTPEGRPLRHPDQAETLFDAPESVPFDEAFWLEIKVAHQFTSEGANGRYSAQVLSVTRGDVSKLAKDPDILHAGLGLVAFMADEIVAQNDLRVWYERFLDKGLPVGYPSTRMFELTNRLGNGLCAVAIAPVNHL